jgi:hypothetical protein
MLRIALVTFVLLQTTPATGARGPYPDPESLLPHHQKIFAVQPFIFRVTECIATTVLQKRRSAPEAELSELITESFDSCRLYTRALINRINFFFGNERQNPGEEFIMGPYLKDLPGQVEEFLRRMPHTDQ